uniref:Secreted protein n=1 Tax=Trypanosoma congolense (strain IL3000) TaxID=1068625 RepID=G0UMB2_TRYCI|nr:hypothetical protein, unlikely [Trypanosoma congolense IL3000]
MFQCFLASSFFIALVAEKNAGGKRCQGCCGLRGFPQSLVCVCVAVVVQRACALKCASSLPPVFLFSKSGKLLFFLYRPLKHRKAVCMQLGGWRGKKEGGGGRMISTFPFLPSAPFRFFPSPTPRRYCFRVLF